MFMLYFANAILLLLLHYIQKISPLHSSKIFNKTEQAVTMLFLLLFFFSIEGYFFLCVRLCWGERFFVYGQNIFNMISLN